MRCSIIGVGLGAMVLATPASAGDGPRPRTPVQWPQDAPCLVTVDRSVDPIIVVAYEIPREDADLTADEVPDGRRHQLFALCRDSRIDAFARLPRWITWADVEAASAVGLVDPTTLSQADVLETSTDWADCWMRLHGDDDRRPITFEAAAGGVAWDTSEVPAGVYVLGGYTWDPPASLWSRRVGIVRVTDAAGADDRPPGAAIVTSQTSVAAGEVLPIVGCVDAMDGSTLVASWTSASRVAPWTSWAEVPVSTGDFAIDFAPPPELAEASVWLRLDVVDPRARRWSAFMGSTVYVVAEPEAESSSSSGTAASSSSDDSSGSSSETSGTSDTSGSSETSGSLGDGCSCATLDTPAFAWLMLAFIPRRGRRCRWPRASARSAET